jgi:hypothetical protein
MITNISIKKYIMDTIELFNNFISSIPDDKLHIIVLPDSGDRSVIYEYMNNVCPGSKRIGTRCSVFDNWTILKSKCKCGNIVNIPLEDKKSPFDCYCETIYCGNIYSGDCEKCNAHIIYEPNYDDFEDINVVGNYMKNNVIVIGNCIKYNDKHIESITKRNIILDDIDWETIIKKCQLYEISAPDKNFYVRTHVGKNYKSKYNKKLDNLGVYIDNCIKSNKFLKFI